MRPALVDRAPLAGLIACVRSWYDCGNGYGVSVISGGYAFTVAAGLWMDRYPGRLRRLLVRTEVLHSTAERVHVTTVEEAEDLVRFVAALPSLGATLPPRRLLPACEYAWCVVNGMACTTP